jgi:hypothetical protein
MGSRIRHLHRDESGMTLVFVGASFIAFMAASTLAIDVGMFMTARTQAQNAADAGALAGAVALAFNDFNNRTASGPAVQSAVNTALANDVMRGDVSVTPADVTFPAGAGGVNNRVRVEVYRTAARNNPVPALLAPIFGMSNLDVAASATAEAALANAATCVLPFTIPDRWIERQTPAWDPNDTFNAFPSSPSTPADIYRDAASGSYTGYDSVRDKGLRLTLKAGTGNNAAPSFYFGLALPGNSGAQEYEWSISNCNPSMMHFGDLLTAEPGNMAGPTRQGVEALIAQDPAAYWDTATNKVVSSMNPSPRIKVVPIFDPYYWNVGKQNGRPADLKAANYVGFFVEGLQGNDVIGRITPVSGLVDGDAAPAPAGAFPRAIRLIE